MDKSGVFNRALADVIIDVGEDAKEGVKAAAPRDSGKLKRSIALKLFPRRDMGFILKAGVKNKQGENYGWFTELGTDEAANHAVDLIGYVHRSKNPPTGNWTGIPAMHWFSRPTNEALKDAGEKITTAIMDAYNRLFPR